MRSLLSCLVAATAVAQQLTTIVPCTAAESEFGQDTTVASPYMYIVTVSTSSTTVPANLTFTFAPPTGTQDSVPSTSRVVSVLHVHAGDIGVPGAVLIPLGAISGLTQAFTVSNQGILDQITSGSTYLNIHTNAYGSGEYRGQIIWGSQAIGTANRYQVVPVPNVAHTATAIAHIKTTAYAGGVSSQNQVVNFAMRGTLSSAITSINVYSGAAAGRAGGAILCTLPTTTTSSTNCSMPSSVIASIAAGALYVQVNTVTFPDGEIRAQLVSPSQWVPNAVARNVPVMSSLALGANVVPTPISTNAGGTTNVFPMLNADGTLNATLVFGSYSGLSTVSTGAHIHGPAGPSGNAAVITFLPWYATTSFNFAYHVIPATATLSLNGLYCDKTYVAVHTTANPGQEIRGSLVKSYGNSAFCTANNVLQTTIVPCTPAESEFGQSATIVSPYIYFATVTVSGVNAPAVFTVAFDPAAMSQSTVPAFPRTVNILHVHAGDIGVSGAVILGLNTINSTTQSYTITDQTILDTITSGGAYLNIHTTTNGAGEFRGQILFGSQAIGTANRYQVAPVPNVAHTATAIAHIKITAYAAGVTSQNQVVNFVMRGALSSAVTSINVYVGAGAGRAGGSILCALPTTATSSTSCAMPSSIIASIAAGSVYVQVNTATFPDGEIRAQLVSPSQWVPNVVNSNIANVRALANGAKVQPSPIPTTAGGNFFAYPILNADGSVNSTVSFGAFAGLSSPSTGAHIHGSAGPNATADVLVFLPWYATTNINFAYHVIPATSTFTLSAVYCDNSYVAVHTTTNPGQEIRGQITRNTGGSPFCSVSSGAAQTSIAATTIAVAAAFIGMQMLRRE